MSRDVRCPMCTEQTTTVCARGDCAPRTHTHHDREWMLRHRCFWGVVQRRHFEQQGGEWSRIELVGDIFRDHGTMSHIMDETCIKPNRRERVGGRGRRRQAPSSPRGALPTEEGRRGDARQEFTSTLCRRGFSATTWNT